MENFVVSARKYRPSTFSSVKGQPSIVTTLKNAIINHQLAQAFLFCGPRGVGKTTCARIFAKTINCTNITSDGEACNECASCLSFNTSASFNIYELDAASNNSVDDIRSLVDQVRIPPQAGKYKVYIIDEVHMLTQSAFNAFLKTLEEPPAYAKFILATTEKHKIIPTVLSRCQIYDFKRIGVEDIVAQLAFVAANEGIEADTEALLVIAQKADGALRDALSMFDQLVNSAGKRLTYHHVINNLNVLDYDYYFRITDYILQQNVPGMLLLVDEIINNGFDGQHFINGLAEHLRNLLICTDIETIKLLDAGEATRQRYERQSKECNSDFLLKALDIANRCDIDYRISNNKRIHVEIALLQMIALLQTPGSGTAKTSLSNLSQPVMQQHTPATESTTPSTVTIPVAQQPAEPMTPTAEKIQAQPISDPATHHHPKTADTHPRKPLPTELGTISIKGMGEPIRKPDEKKDEEPEGNEDTDGVSEAVIEYESLHHAWIAFAESVAGHSPNLHAVLTSSQPFLKENNRSTVVFNVSSLVQEKELNDHKSDLLHYLREKLQEPRLRIEINVVKAETYDNKSVYNPIDKYRYMARKNPGLEYMKSKLMLDIDF